MDTLFLVTLSSLIFTVLIMLLVFIIVVLGNKLVAQGNIQISINESADNTLEVPAGGTLLSALSAEGIYLPSACGGGGTCAMCRCQITEGAGDILPTESGHFSRSEISEKWRLACQVKVKSNMNIIVPDEVLSIQKFTCTVVSNDNVATFIKELHMKIDDGKNLDFKAGGYIQLYVPPYNINFKDFDIDQEYHEDWDKYNLWRYHASNDEEIFRAYSMANHPAEGNIVKLNIRIATPPPGKDVPPGIASSYVFNLKPGDKVTVSGPYGEFFAQETEREMMYIGGGAGMAPLRSHIFDLFQTKNTKRKVSYWYGARSLREVFYQSDFDKIEKENDNFKFHLALSEPMEEDHWTGHVGFIHQVVLKEYLENHPDPTDIEYYMCGPPPMISAVNRMLDDLGVDRDMIYFDDFGS
ncbi:MAG: NADH:ubiquinone reductase (Na(+)-transporting) subunit F [Spirochaetia bacterium]|nr:NADH:ubiquinone reductase (Na(+)-transporting) subunit F [Spirochaetia bacterium]